VFPQLRVVGGGACREEERREDDDKAREGTNLYLRLGRPITEPLNGGAQLWTLFSLDLVSTLYSTPGASTLSTHKLLAGASPGYIRSILHASQARREKFERSWKHELVGRRVNPLPKLFGILL